MWTLTWLGSWSAVSFLHFIAHAWRNHRSVQCFCAWPAAWGHREVNGERIPYFFQSVHNRKFAFFFMGLAEVLGGDGQGGCQKSADKFGNPSVFHYVFANSVMDLFLVPLPVLVSIPLLLLTNHFVATARVQGVFWGMIVGSLLCSLVLSVCCFYQHLWSCLVHSSSGKIWLHVFFWICSRSHVNCLGLVVSIFPEPVARESTLIGSDVTLRSCGKSAAGCGVGPKRSAHLR